MDIGRYNDLVRSLLTAFDEHRGKASDYHASHFIDADLEVIQHAAETGEMEIDRLEQAIKRSLDHLYASPLGGIWLPDNFHETPFGALISEARAWCYQPEDFCETQQEACKFLERDRTMLRRYEKANWIVPVWRMRSRQYLWKDL